MRRFIASLMCVALVAPGCATAGGTRLQTPTTVLASSADQTVLADYVRQLPVGSRIKASTTLPDGPRTVRGTLLKTTDRSVIVQPRGRVAEPLVEIPYAQVRSLELDTPGSGTGRAVAVGAAVGAGAAIGVLLVLAAIFSD
jgi:hypothetical protein